MEKRVFGARLEEGANASVAGRELTAEGQTSEGWLTGCATTYVGEWSGCGWRSIRGQVHATVKSVEATATVGWALVRFQDVPKMGLLLRDDEQRGAAGRQGRHDSGTRGDAGGVDVGVDVGEPVCRRCPHTARQHWSRGCVGTCNCRRFVGREGLMSDPMKDLESRVRGGGEREAVFAKMCGSRDADEMTVGLAVTFLGMGWLAALVRKNTMVEDRYVAAHGVNPIPQVQPPMREGETHLDEIAPLHERDIRRGAGAPCTEAGSGGADVRDVPVLPTAVADRATGQPQELQRAVSAEVRRIRAVSPS